MSSETELNAVPSNEVSVQVTTIHNRVFQKYAIDNSVYFVPVDQDEAHRLAVQHRMLRIVFDNKLIFPPVPEPRRVLDCGHGTAAWAVEVAERFPNCEVIGVDISPHMRPEVVPANLQLQLTDLNHSLTFSSNTFDVVQSRLVAGGIHKTRWQSYVQDMARVTRPGGWIQMAEIYFNCQSDNNTLTLDHALRQWSAKYLASVDDIKDPRIPMRMRDLMIGAGLADVDQTMIPLPLCGWSTTSLRDWNIGEANKDNIARLLTSMALYPCTERLHTPLNDLLVLIARAINESRYPGFKAYFPLYVCIGRKPR